ncbi:MAG: Ser-Thr-rich GPI-anchored membrane family protein [Bacteroidota bacterium]
MKNNFNYLMRGILYLFYLIPICWVHAQSLEIKSISLNGSDVIISYDLLDDDLNHKYTLRLYSSQDNFVQPLTNVVGDVGIDQSVGGNKQIIWHVKDELGDDFKGDVSLELKGKLYIPFVTLNNFEDISSMKRSRPYNVTWAAGRGSNVLTFDLFNGKDEIVHTYTNIANVGEYQLEIPKDIKPGKNYRFRITDQRNKEDVVFTPYFTIKRKIPLVAKVALFGLAGSGAVLLGGRGNSGVGGGEVPLLPDPILPNN